jgi:DNA-binding NtrC family response regulator
MINEGRFREDLYYRLAELHVRVPALRERRGDIALLAEHFLLRASLAASTRAPQLGPDALERLVQHDWPGNVRELRNLMHRLAVLAPGARLTEQTMGRELRADQGAPALPFDANLPYKEARAAVLRQFEAFYLAELVDRCQGNLSRAARHAQIARHNLRRLFRKAGMGFEEGE